MMSSNRRDYGSSSDWLSALRQDEAWQSQLQRLQTSADGDVNMHREDAVRRIGRGETFEFWEIHRHQVERVVSEVWDMAELSLPKLKIQTIGMLSMEWLEQQAEKGLLTIEEAKKPGTKKKPKKKPCDKPKTLKYYQHGNNGVLMMQRKRVTIVFKKFREWEWIDPNTSPDDFDTFFEGEPRHCNITWTGSTTILTILLQELLKQAYIEKQTRCSAKSLVEQQFGKTANSDRKRLDNVAEERIRAVLYILDTRNPLNPGGENDKGVKAETIDASIISVYAELFAGQLRSTKGI